jgi:hypothetical protein
MNMPKRASRHHFIRVLRSDGVSSIQWENAEDAETGALAEDAFPGDWPADVFSAGTRPENAIIAAMPMVAKRSRRMVFSSFIRSAISLQYRGRLGATAFIPSKRNFSIASCGYRPSDAESSHRG